jgi:signal transduction histidine kinase
VKNPRWMPTDAGQDSVVLRRTMLRMGLQVGLTVAAIVVLLAGVAVVVVLRTQSSDAQSLVRDTVARADDVNDPPTDVWMTIQTGTTRLTTRGMPAWLPDVPALNRVAHSADPGVVDIMQVDTHGHDYLVRTERRKLSIVQAALDLGPNSLERSRLLLALLLSGSLGLLLAIAAGAWYGRRAVVPLSTALSLQRRFISDASHELRTPLTLLSTRAQLLRRQLNRDQDSTAFQSDVDGLVADARHLSEILDDLLIAADPRGDTPNQPVELAGLAEQVAASSAGAAADAGVVIHCVYDGPVTVLGTRAGLRRALTSLVDNAIRHTRSEVIIAVRRRGNAAAIEVRDDGAGIDPELLPRLFERFASGGTLTSGHRSQRRYGLGLALVSEIAHRHRGTVDANNGPEGGAVLRITLPVAAAKNSARS